jgi:hypothetical protein
VRSRGSAAASILKGDGYGRGALGSGMPRRAVGPGGVCRFKARGLAGQ